MQETPVNYEIVVDPEYGYHRLDPVPSGDDLNAFYQSQYYDLIRKGGRAPEIAAFMAGGEKAERERAWLRQTLYGDIAHFMGQLAPGKRILDVGCGTGEVLKVLVAAGFEAEGLDPSDDAVAQAKADGLKARAATLEAFADAMDAEGIAPFDGLVTVNVLEHVPRPEDFLRTMLRIVRPGGVVGIRVPNDFTEFQAAAHAKVGGREWWKAVPDHVNYFNFDTLHALLDRLGFEVEVSQADFPMEVFLLMGDNYVGNPEVGSECHRRRMSFEMALPDDLRRKLYRSLADLGIGRDCLVFARRR